jgi:DNA ligase-1
LHNLKDEDMHFRGISLLLSWSLLALGLLSPRPAHAATPPRVMLPTVYKSGVDVGNYWVSEKLDGVRGRWDGHRLWARSGAAIDPPAWFTAHWPTLPMDGEIWIGRGRFEAISTLVRTPGIGGDGWRQVHFMVFDLPGDRDRFELRVLHMRSLIGNASIPWLRAIPQFRLRDAAALDARLKTVVAAGGEGLVLQHRDARYTVGRSDTLLKYKPYDDAEARVVAYTAGQGKYAGQLGALVVRRPDGMQFRIGGGFSDAERAHPPPIDSNVTYRYNGLTGKGTPRFARFMRIRHDMPPPDPK